MSGMGERGDKGKYRKKNTQWKSNFLYLVDMREHKRSESKVIIFIIIIIFFLSKPTFYDLSK